MYKTIFTYLPSAKSAPLLSAVAAALGEKCGATVIGAHNSVRIMLYGGVPSDYLAQHNHRQREEAEAIEAAFGQAAKAHGLQHEWRHKALADNAAFGDIIEAARTADLIIAGGTGEGDPLGQWYDLPIRLVLETGRPVLLVPENCGTDKPGEQVTIAWNQSKESARATFDALPLLQLATRVRVLSVNSTEESTEDPTQELVASLKRHGVDAEGVVSNTTDRSESEHLLAEHARSGSDLLVMGCYGHSRVREFVFGGVTQHALNHLKTPVLMSH
jgi:nucleotide-binding universal stress UspA family protein